MCTWKFLTTLFVVVACPRSSPTKRPGLCAFAAIEIPKVETR